MDKLVVQPYKKSINESSFSAEQIAMIWDFYVTKSVAATAAQKRTVSEYGHRSFPWKKMCVTADLEKDHIRILAANSINKTLENLDLSIESGKGDSKKEQPIDVTTPRIVCSTPYTIADEEPPKPKIGEAESVLTHIRNALAHGNTYFFGNGFVLLEDKGQGGNVTARIMLSQQTLIDWIAVIDKEQKYYVIQKMSEV